MTMCIASRSVHVINTNMRNKLQLIINIPSQYFYDYFTSMKNLNVNYTMKMLCL